MLYYIICNVIVYTLYYNYIVLYYIVFYFLVLCVKKNTLFNIIIQIILHSTFFFK